MSTTEYPETLPTQETFYNMGYFDHDLLNVPQAQDRHVYAGYIDLDEELGLINAYVPPPPLDELEIQYEYDIFRIEEGNRATVKMEALDNGTGRLVGSRKVVEALASRLDTDVDAREASLRREHMSRLLGNESPSKALYIDDKHPSYMGQQAPRTVWNPTPISTRKELPTAAAMLDLYGPPFNFSLDGLRPTTTVRQCEPVPPEVLSGCIDPILLGREAWDAPFRRQGLEIMIGSSYLYPRTDVLAPTTPKRAEKKRKATSSKITKAHEKTKDVIKKKASAVSRKEKKGTKPQQMHNTVRRRNSNYGLI